MSTSVTKKLSVATAGAVLIALGVGGAAQATVLTFDDLPLTPAEDGLPISDGYGGFSWDNFYYLTSSTYFIQGTGYQNGTVSAENVAYNAYGELAIASSSLFDFNSAYLTGAWNNGLSITVEGLKNGLSLYSKTVVVDTTGPTLFDFDYRGVDELRFTSFGGEDAGIEGGDGTQFVMDNFTYQAVPEPTSILGTLALGAFGASRMLKRKKLA